MKLFTMIVGLVWGLCGVANANPYFKYRPATADETAVAEHVAQNYWRIHEPARLGYNGMPSCGMPSIHWIALQDSNSAEAYECRIVFNSQDWMWAKLRHLPKGVTSGSDTWVSFCTAFAHEWGHLILGPTYFAVSNPSDPGHSPDPTNLMYPMQTVPLSACRIPDPQDRESGKNYVRLLH